MLRRLIVVLILGLALSACRSASTDPTPTASPVTSTITPTLPATPTPFEPEPTATQTETPTPVPTPEVPPEGYGPDEFPPDVNPLTGLPQDDPSTLDRRPLAIKVTNFPRYTRPQWALSLADIVYEYYQNGGISRFHAIFYGNDTERVGPIRSARFPDVDLIRMYKSVFAFGSADYRVLNRFAFAEFANRTVNEYPAGCGPMCRVETSTFNHLVTNTEDLSEYIETRGVTNDRQDLTGMFFQVQTPEGGEAAETIYIRYGLQVYGRWDYDPATRRYLRHQDTRDDFGGGEEYEQLEDRLTEEPVAADNVVVLLVPHEYFSRQPEIIEIRLNGTGTAYAFRNGRVYEVVWNRVGQDKVLYLTYPDGTPFPFHPGNTWFEVLGGTSEVTQPDGGTYRFQFRIP